MKYIFITNPSNAHSEVVYQQIVQVAKKYNLNYQILSSKSSEDASYLAKKYSIEDNIIICVGGDGSLHNIVNGINKDSYLSLIPYGTGNDFAKMFTKQKHNIDQYVKQILKNNYKVIDLAIDSNNIKCINNVSFGLDAYVNWYVCTKMKSTFLPKSIYYPLAAIKAILHYPYYDISIKIDENELLNYQAMLCFIGNGNYYGSGYCATPQGKLDDHLLSICIVEKMNTFAMIKMLNKYKKGLHINHPKVHIYYGKQVEVSFKKNIVGQIDGEPFFTNKYQIQILPSYINYVIPKFKD